VSPSNLAARFDPDVVFEALANSKQARVLLLVSQTSCKPSRRRHVS
jgi:hypothetical protein